MLYDFSWHFIAQEKLSSRLEIFEGESEITGFAVSGGMKGTIDRNIDAGRLMVEVYQARQFHNIHIQKPINQESFKIDRIYYRELFFDFVFAVTSLKKNSKFKSILMIAKGVKIVEPPNRDSKAEALKMTFPPPEIRLLNTGEYGILTVDTL